MRRRIIASLTSLCVLLMSLGGPLFAAQAGGQEAGQGASQPAGTQPPAALKLIRGDVIKITVDPQHMRFDVELPIQPDGRIYYPVVGEIIAEGKTIPELTDLIKMGLAKELRNYTVTIQLTHVAPRAGGQAVQGQPQGRVTILGAVKQPLVVQNVPENFRLVEAMVQAGGALPNADIRRIVVIHSDLSSVIVDLNTVVGQNFQLQPGDTVRVPELEAVGLVASGLGEVMRPGAQQFKVGATLLDLLQAVGGPTQNADLKNATLKRIGQDQPTPIDMDALWNHGEMSLNLTLVNGDVLVIPRNIVNLVYLLGGVTHPGAFPIRGGEKLLDIIVQGGSPVPNANLNKVTLTRLTQGGGRTTRKLNLKELNKGNTATLASTEVMPGDVVYVPVSKPKKTFTETITPVLTILSLITTLQSLSQISRNTRSSGGGGGGGVGR
jgi:polysaccharide export outer membrane protein